MMLESDTNNWQRCEPSSRDHQALAPKFEFPSGFKVAQIDFPLNWIALSEFCVDRFHSFSLFTPSSLSIETASDFRPTARMALHLGSITLGRIFSPRTSEGDFVCLLSAC